MKSTFESGKNFVKNYPFLVILGVIMAVITFGAYTISFAAIKAVAEDIDITVPWLYPLLFELMVVAAAIGGVYLAVNNIEDKQAKQIKNVMFFLGTVLAIGFNIWHTQVHLNELWASGKYLSFLVNIIGHGLAPFTVVLTSEFMILVTKHTFAKKQETEAEKLRKEMEVLGKKLEKATNSNNEVVAELKAERKEKGELTKEITGLRGELERFVGMPEMYYDLWLVMSQEMTKEDYVAKYPNISTHRLTGWESAITG